MTDSPTPSRGPSLLEASKEALRVLTLVQIEEEKDPLPMPWPVIQDLEEAIRKEEAENS